MNPRLGSGSGSFSPSVVASFFVLASCMGVAQCRALGWHNVAHGGGIMSCMGWWHSELTLHVCTFTEDGAANQEEEAPTGEWAPSLSLLRS